MQILAVGRQQAARQQQRTELSHRASTEVSHLSHHALKPVSGFCNPSVVEREGVIHSLTHTLLGIDCNVCLSPC